MSFVQLQFPSFLKCFAFLKRNYWLSAWALIASVHWATIAYPPFNGDEAAFVSDAFIRPEYLRHSFQPPWGSYHYYYSSLIPGLMWVLHYVSHAYGFDPHFVRAFSWLSGSLALLLMGGIVKSITRSTNAALAMEAVGLGTLFLISTHDIRAEAFLLFVAALNVYWAALLPDRILGFVAGFLGTVALIFHPGAVFVVAAIPVTIFIMKRRRAWTDPSFLWWIIGGELGLIVVFNAIDIEGGMSFYQWEHLLPLNNNVVTPGLIAFHGNALSLTTRLMIWIHRPVDAWHYHTANPLMPAAMASMLAMLGWQMRRFHAFNTPHRFILLFTICVCFAYSSLSGSPNTHYLLHVYPWLYMQFILGCSVFWRDTSFPDKNDGVTLICILLFLSTLGCAYGAYASFIIGSFCIATLAGSWKFLTKRSRGLTLLAVGLIFIEAPFAFHWWYFGKYLLVERPLVFVAIVCAPWILVKYTSDAISIRPLGLRTSSKNIILLMGTILLVYFCGECESCVRILKIAKIEAGALQSAAPRYRHERRMIGPMLLWLYEPSIVLQDPMGFIALRNGYPSINVAESFWKFRPTILLLPKEATDFLIQDASKEGLQVKRSGAAAGPFIETFGKLEEVTLAHGPREGGKHQ